MSVFSIYRSMISLKSLLGERLRFDWKIAGITVISTLLLMVDYYRLPTPFSYLNHLILYLLVPLMVILVLFRESPKEYGFSLGDWRAGLVITVIGVLVAVPIVYLLASGNASLRAYYQPFLPGLPWTTFLDLIGWEFLFRGWILFGYARKFGTEALWLQAVPFALMHNGKPEVEALSAIFGGIAFGWMAWQTKSFLWPFLIHWFIATFVILVAAGVVQ